MGKGKTRRREEGECFYQLLVYKVKQDKKEEAVSAKGRLFLSAVSL